MYHDDADLIPTRKMKRVFKWWWGNLSQEEQDRIRQCIYEAYAEKRGIEVKDISKDIERIKQERKQEAREYTVRATK